MILVVDDDEVSRIVVSAAIESAGMETIEAENGQQAVARAVERLPDLIVLDVQMPEMNGFEVCEVLRHDERTKLIPVLIMTGLEDESSIDRAYEVGATDFIPKPINGTILGHRVRYLTRAGGALAKAESASRAKSEFLANISHEIRTPMTAILGYADEMLADGDLTKIPPERLEAVGSIRRNGLHLLEIINHILDLSKIEAGRLEVESQAVAPLQMAAEVGSLMRVQASEKDLEFSVDCTSPVPETIQTDPMRVRQILINLAGNAIKFTKSGSVRLVTRMIEDGPDRKLVFEVIDTGIGVEKNRIRHLFEPFTQADASTTRLYGGTGLGLTISHRLMSLLGGTIEVESEIGQGSTFRVIFPLGQFDGRLIDVGPAFAETCSAGAAERSRPKLTGTLVCRILLAEDGLDNQRLFRRLLEQCGAEVEVVDNGHRALERTLEAQENDEPFDIILMDMQMPVLDGYDATRALRRTGYQRPIVALTAHAMDSDRARCLEAGCDEFITKPIDRALLIETLSRYLEKPQG